LILDDIIDHKRREVEEAKRREPLSRLQERISPRKPGRFLEAISKPERLCLIAELKKASPSRGVICADFDPPAIARKYAEGGASALSVLTDKKFFQGDASYLAQAREASGLPALRKDFIIDEYQVWESAAIGADSILLIVAALSPDQLKDYLQLATEIGLDSLVEVHDADQLDIALKAESQIVGINNRDLRTFKTELRVTLELAKEIPAERLIVSESGIHTGEDARRVRDAGANAILVGEALMTSGDISGKIRELIGDQS
jgi:indole-3-glycerol phosphate synthase